MDDMREDEQAREARLRRAVSKAGYALRKSRLRGDTHLDDHGGYRIVDPDRNAIVAGERFDLSLDDVEAWVMW